MILLKIKNIWSSWLQKKNVINRLNNKKLAPYRKEINQKKTKHKETLNQKKLCMIKPEKNTNKIQNKNMLIQIKMQSKVIIFY